MKASDGSFALSEVLLATDAMAPSKIAIAPSRSAFSNAFPDG